MNNYLATEAIERFIRGCWTKVNDYYCDTVSEKNIYIYGAGVYGRFLFQAFEHLGYSLQIKAFVIDVNSDRTELFGVPILNFDQVNFSNEDIVVVGVQNSSRIIANLENRKIKYIEADYDCEFYQNNLMYSVYKCIEVSSISDMCGKITQYYEGCLGNENDILSLYEEDISRSIISNRLEFYKTGDVAYIDMIPVNYKQYFQENYYHLSDQEVYVDCGAFDGDSINSFYGFTNGKYKKIIGIEPDKISFNKLVESSKNYHNIELFECATGSENTVVCFESKGVLGSTVSDAGEPVEVKKLDDLLKDQRVTLIKMDIEGAELDSLIGAQELIKRCKPKLAVCIYHKMDDIIKIPKYIKELVPEYQFKVRQHSKSMLETVLYAEV